MTSYRVQRFSVAELIRLNKNDRLKIQPKFQRRQLWPPIAKAYLIDTVIRGIPMPKIYLRDFRDPAQRTVVLEVVDGQQRISALLDFVDNQFRLNAKLSPDYPNKRFVDLPQSVQRKLRDYRLTAEVIQDATDDDVWRLFARLNRYSVKINNQETRHAKFAGRFRIASYELSERFKEQLAEMRVISKAQYKRMRDAEIVSDLLVALFEGVTDINDLDDVYEKYDSSFDREDDAKQFFVGTMNWVSFELGETVRQTKFRNHAWFYSLFLALADARRGIPKGLGKADLPDVGVIIAGMKSLDSAMRQEPLPPRLGPLQRALAQATSHVPERKLRHTRFYQLVTSGR